MKCQKYSVAAGIFLFFLAAMVSISLLLAAIDFGQINPAKDTIFYSLGKMFTGVYGFSSLFIPVFLIIAGIQCFNAKWRIRNGVILVGSIVPFFTLDAVEHICRMIIASNSDSVMIVKLSSTLLIGALILAAEYLLLSILGDVIENSLAENSDMPEYIFNDDDTEISENEEINELDEILEDNDDDLNFSDENDDDAEEKIDFKNDRIFLQQKEILKDLINDGKPKNEEIQNDATVVDEPTIIENEDFDEERPVPETVTEDEILSEEDFSEPELPEEPSPFDHIFDEVKPQPEEETTVTEEAEEEAEPETEEILENSEPELPELIEEKAEETETIESDSFEPAEFGETEIISEEVDSEPELIEEAVEIQESPAEEIEAPETIDFDDDTIEDDEIPVNAEDFQNDFDDMNDVSPVSFDEEAVEEENIEDDFNSDLDFENLPSMEIEENQDVAEENEIESEVQNGLEEEITDEDFISEEEFEEPVQEEDSLESEENPADFINIEDIAETTEEPESSDEPFETQEDEEPFGVEDIFSQMEADAAANPVIKNQDEPALKDNLYQQEEKVESESHSAPLRKLSEYKIPTDLLDQFQNNEYWRIDDETKAAGENLKKTLNEFGIEAEVTGIRKGPVVTMFELLPAPGVKLSKIVNLQDNIALALAAKSVRIVAPIPGRHAVGIEIPNKERAIVSFREIIEQNLPEYKKMAIPVILGKDISGQSQIIDIAKTPHLLIAGATGAGKSVCVNSIILSILYNRSPNDVKLIMVDPKVVELKLYNDIPHLLTPVVTEPKRALQVLQYCICEMERRYALLDGMGVRDIASYNTRIRERKIATEKLPYIVVIIDEFADLMATSGKELETNVARLTAMSRAVGIHLVLATQRPSVNVITGLIKANIPSRIAFMVASRQDSQIIIDSIGAEKLLGKGDMLYTSAVNPIPTRIQGTLVGDNEVERVVDYVKTFGGPDYIDDEIFVDDDEEMDEEPGLFSDGEDPLYDQALQIVIQAGKASASYIQRRLKIGYNRAARLVEDMEARGIVGPANGSKPREVIHVP